MKKFSIVLLLLTALPVWAEPVKNWEQAIHKSMEVFKINNEQLTSLPIECVIFSELKETAQDFQLDIRENHNEKCGGDPETAPRLFSFRIDKETGQVKTDAVLDRDYYDGSFKILQ